MQSSPRPIALSLFSGAGGLDIGFHTAGFRIIACVEKEASFCKTLQLNLGRYLESDCIILNRDIQQLQPDEIPIEHVDFIIGGPPCQSFSAIGRRAGGIEGIRDERGSLFEYYCRLVQHYQPKGFLFENVRGILGANHGNDWQFIVEAFAKLGYQLFYRVLDCADYGVPQHRERLILVGTKEHDFKFPRPTHGTDSSAQKPYVSAKTAIADLQDPQEPVHIYSGKYGKLLSEVPPGMNYHYFTREMGYPNPIFAWRSRFSDFLYKADPEKPVRTIVAKMGAYSGPFHWKNRKFTLQEFKRLQTFPDDYQFAGNLNTVLQQLGNSVPPVFAEQLAKAVLQQLFDIPLGLELLENYEKLSFDGRKSKKAKVTRTKRLTPNQSLQLKLFDYGITNLPEIDETNFIVSVDNITENIFNYSSLKQRNKIKTLGCEPGTSYRFSTKRAGEKCYIDVDRYDADKTHHPILRYHLEFHHIVGDGIKQIECTLFSNSSEDIAVAWDAIEDCLSSYSGYQTMMDVYGHFTEPHPIFDLRMEILTDKPSFLLRFAKEFSFFEKTRKVWAGEFLQKLYGEEQNFDLTKVAYKLRELRFDVRVHQTNSAISPGYFRCCYPFTININKQVSIAWKPRIIEKTMVVASEYNSKLSQAYIQAESIVQAETVSEAISEYKRLNSALNHPLKTLDENGNQILLGKTIAEGLETIVNNFGQNKYLYSILITSLLEKLVHSNQDIRYAQNGLTGGYSNRSTDAAHVTPFLKRHGLTSCAASGAESGRNFERPNPYTLNYKAKPKGKGNREAFLGVIHASQEEGIDPFPCIVLLMVLDLQNKQKAVFQYPQPQGLTIQQIFDAVMEHHQNAQGQGRSRLPVLAIQAIYQCLAVELSRYQSTALRNPPNRHTANDKEGWIGDIQIDRIDATPFEGVEVKSGIKITSDMVRALPAKFSGQAVERYYILSTSEPYIAKNEFDEVMQTVKIVRESTGCQVIVNGLNQSLRYYLRLISDTNKFLINYTEQIQTDQDVKDEHRELWVQILASLDKFSSS